MMERDIRFRAWDNDSSRYVKYTAHIGMSLNGSTVNLQTGEGDYVLEQFTGVKDSDGVDIFEGDIVQHEDGALEEVVWQQTHLRWGTRDSRGYGTALRRFAPYWKVVGNIHENPELMKG